MQEYSKIIQCKYSQVKMQTLMLEKNYVLIRVFYDKWLIKKNLFSIHSNKTNYN